MTVICITGTPGCGKTTLSKRLAKDLDFSYIDVKKIIKENNLIDHVDKERDCNVIDTEELCEILMKLKGDLIIDSHFSQDLPSEFVDLIVVVKCDLKELKTRLENRGYSESKIRENLDSEIFDICMNECLEFGHKNIFLFNSERDYFGLLEEIRKIKS